MTSVKLIKADSRTWNGNGHGYSGATWGVQHHPNIRVSSVGGAWIARDTLTGKLIAGICSSRVNLIDELNQTLNTK